MRCISTNVRKAVSQWHCSVWVGDCLSEYMCFFGRTVHDNSMSALASTAVLGLVMCRNVFELFVSSERHKQVQRERRLRLGLIALQTFVL